MSMQSASQRIQLISRMKLRTDFLSANHWPSFLHFFTDSIRPSFFPFPNAITSQRRIFWRVELHSALYSQSSLMHTRLILYSFSMHSEFLWQRGRCRLSKNGGNLSQDGGGYSPRPGLGRVCRPMPDIAGASRGLLCG